MRKTTFILGLILVVFNILVGLVASTYSLFNVFINTCIILAITALILISQSIELKPGFKVSLPFTFLFLGVIQFILGCFSQNHLTDNWFIISILVILLFEVILLVITYSVSKATNK